MKGASNIQWSESLCFEVLGLEKPSQILELVFIVERMFGYKNIQNASSESVK
jgi:hypothetical protein